MTDILIEWGDLNTDMPTEKTPCGREDSHLQAKGDGTDPSLTALRRNQLFQHLDFILIASRFPKSIFLKGSDPGPLFALAMYYEL